MAARSLAKTFEWTLALTLGALFITPLGLTVARYLPVNIKVSRALDRAWLGRPKLSGVTSSAAPVPLTWQNLRTGDFQKSKATQFDESFAGREALIRYTNELWFRLFREPANLSSTAAVGENGVLFEKTYLQEYFLYRNPKSVFEPWVKDLRKLQDFCRGIGMGFVVVIVPTKPSIYPEDAPLRWRKRYNPEPRASVLISDLLRENGVIFVDMSESILREKAKRPPAPLFPKGGIHWNRRAALITVNAIQGRLAEQNKPVEPVESTGNILTDQPHGEEADMASLMNLARRWRYPIEKITIKPSTRTKAHRMTMAMIGDSFCWSMLDILNESGQYSEIGFFFHYRLYKTRLADGRSKKVRTPGTPVDFSREIFAADCLVLEINEASAVSPINPISAFTEDALHHLPDPAAPRPAFRAD